jgi:hypothetical protein
MKKSLIQFTMGGLIGYAICYLTNRPTDAGESAEITSQKGEFSVRPSSQSVPPTFSDERSAERMKELESRLRQYSKEEAKRLAEKEAVIADSTSSAVESDLSKIKSAVSLTPQQERNIETLLQEYWTYRYTYRELDADDREKLERPNMDIEKAISDVLSEKQRSDYEEHLAHEARSKAEIVATATLGEYPASLGLTEDQKNQIYSNIYNTFAPNGTGREFSTFVDEFNRTNQTAYHPQNLLTVWAAKDLLTEAQLRQLVSSIKKSE